MSRFKVGDWVKFTTPINGEKLPYEPEINSVHKIIRVNIIKMSGISFRYFYTENEYFYDSEVVSANSAIIREKLGVK